MRSRLSKAFFAWKDRFGEMDKNFAMRRKLQATINKGRMRRAFLGWRKVCLWACVDWGLNSETPEEKNGI